MCQSIKKALPRQGCHKLFGRSGTDHAAVILGDDHRGRTWQRAAATWPVTAQACKAFFTWVLDVDEHGLVIRRESHAGDLAFLGANQEPLDLLDRKSVV